MKTTGEFHTHKYEIVLRENTEQAWLMPFGDVHYGAPMHADGAWAEWLEGAKAQERGYYLGMGDYLDLASTSERHILSNRALHESTATTLDNFYREQADKFLAQIAWMGDRLIGLIEGNHYAELSSGITTTQYMAEKLGCKYLGVSAMIRLVIRHSRKSQGSYPLTIYAHHGKGGSRLPGGSLNPVFHMAEGHEADIYLMGHDHQGGVWKRSKLYLNQSMAVKHKTKVYGRTGGFLLGYEPGHTSYIVDRAASPTELGGIKIGLRYARSRTGGRSENEIQMEAVA